MKGTRVRRRVLAGIAVAALALAGCGDGDDDTGTGTGGSEFANLSGSIKATGATFPAPFYTEVITSFKDEAPNLTITYNATGSGTGKKDFGANLNDFAGTDSLVKDTDGPASGSFLYVPTVAAPITVSYHLSGVDKLQLSPSTLAKIFSRSIKTWDDPAIKADNPDAKLPTGKNITVVHRSDGSGTTSNFTKYLAAAAGSDWTLGSGDTVKWAADTQGGEKNTGVATLIKGGDGAIGYVDFSDATASGLTFAAIKNKDGKFVQASVKGAQAALAGAEVKDDLSYNPLNAAGADSYPITSPTFILVRTKYDDAKKKEAVIGFLKYTLGDGQKLAEELGFAPLPDALKTKALAQFDKVS